MKPIEANILEAASLLNRQRIGLDSSGDPPGPVPISEALRDHPRILGLAKHTPKSSKKKAKRNDAR